jgi:hypothetical protein
MSLVSSVQSHPPRRLMRQQANWIQEQEPGASVTRDRELENEKQELDRERERVQDRNSRQALPLGDARGA